MLDKRRILIKVKKTVGHWADTNFEETISSDFYLFLMA